MALHCYRPDNAVFDSRLVRANKGFLVDNGGAWNKSRRTSVKSFQETYPWSSSHENTGSATSAASIGAYYQTVPLPPPGRPHPWRPTFGYETIELTPSADQTMANVLVNANFVPSSLSADTLPNLVTAFERSPVQTSRNALYTRYTPSEWINSCITTYAEADVNRNHSERLRSEAVRLIRETEERTSQAQRDAGRRLGERITDVTFWRNELNTELEKLIGESALLMDTKRAVQKAIEDTEPPLHITQECLYHREGRTSIERVHDHVEKSLLVEVDNVRSCQDKLKALFEQICKQLADLRAVQFSLEEDLVGKEATLGIEHVCHQLNNHSRGINYFAGVEKCDPTISSQESWAAASSHRIARSNAARGKSAQLRSDSEAMISAVATAVWDCWTNSNNALNKRASEMMEAKNRVQLHLYKTQQELFDIEKQIALLRKSIQDKSNPLKVAQTRLEARNHRTHGLEMCRDFAHVRLVQEVGEIQDSVTTLQRKLQEAEHQHQNLLKTKSALETDLKNKSNALYIDREKCMSIRRTLPVNNIIKY